MREVESSQTGESRAQSTDRKPKAFIYCSIS